MKRDYNKFVINKINKLQAILDSEDELILVPTKGVYGEPSGEEFKIDDNISLKDFILKFLSVYNRECATFKKSDLKVADTRPNKYRSFGDIYRICKTYIPNITFLDVVKTLAEIDADPEIEFAYYYCPNIKKRCMSSTKGSNSVAGSYFQNRTGNEFRLSERALNSLLNK